MSPRVSVVALAVVFAPAWAHAAKTESVTRVAEHVAPTVARVEVTVRDAKGALSRGQGSGIVFSADGAILTNDHVIAHAVSITVHLAGGRSLPATIVGRDQPTDLAMLRVPAKDLPIASFADSDGARVGEALVAIGSPFGLEATVTTGVLSAKGRGGLGANAVEDYLQTDASINPGNSGGPIVDLEGKVLGVSTMVVGHAAGLGFAVPSNLARRVAEQLLAKGKVARATAGLGAQDLTVELATELGAKETSGALVNAVDPRGPAGKANLKPGDVVVAIDGKSVHGAQDLVRDVLGGDVGHEATFEVLRGAAKYQTKVTLAELPEATPAAVAITTTPSKSLGLRFEPLAKNTDSEGGCRIRSVALGSPADRAGLRDGDVVKDLGGHAEPSAEQAKKAVKARHVMIRVQRGERVFFAALRR